MAGEPQECADLDCNEPAAYRTRTKPAWCESHIDAILREGGLEPLEPFTTPKAWRLTRCLQCGCEAHYRFEYTLDQNSSGVSTCRACHWKRWATDARTAQGAWANFEPVGAAEAQDLAEAHGFEYLGALTGPSLPDDPHRTRCLHCGRISAQRLADITFGCSCQSNPRRSMQTANVSGPRKKELLKDCGLPVLAWWDHEANDEEQLATTPVRGTRTVAWRCPDCGHRFRARVLDMTAGARCPVCEPALAAAASAEYDRLTRTPVSDFPELVTAWADDADPSTVMMAGDWELRRFLCPQGHQPRMQPLRYLEAGCQTCRGKETRLARLEAVAWDPEAHRMNREIASQWDLTRNGAMELEKLSPNSRRTVWWRDLDCGHQWQASPADREKGQRLRCPVCRTILDSLAYHYPELAAEWSPVNSLSAWQVRPNGQTAFVPQWVCSNDPDHTWTATLASRSAGSGCPDCRQAGKSRVELDHHAATEELFGQASSGQPVSDVTFQRRARWLVDITTVTPDGRPLAVEYDGAYWHADKEAIDTAKTLDLLAAGYRVARLREHPLKPLNIDSVDYLEIVVYATSPRPMQTMRLVQRWATAGDVQVEQATWAD